MADNLIDKNIGPYHIIDRIGVGGMSIVYLAEDTRLNRNVALKMLPKDFIHNQTFQKRFEREARVVASLEHAGIVPVYDFGSHEGQPYIIMRYMPNGTLERHIADPEPMSLADVLAMLSSVGGALDMAHGRGIIHRDIKPSNILFDENDSAYLTDFGIVRIAEGTTTGTGGSGIMGTPAYVAPEMTDQGPITHLVDLYALGITVYETLTGEVPFRADTPLGMLMAHHVQPVPDITAIRADLPEHVQDAIHKMLSKNPDERFTSAQAFYDALSGLPESPQGEVRVMPVTVLPSEKATAFDLKDDLEEEDDVEPTLLTVPPDEEATLKDPDPDLVDASDELNIETPPIVRVEDEMLEELTEVLQEEIATLRDVQDDAPTRIEASAPAAEPERKPPPTPDPAPLTKESSRDLYRVPQPPRRKTKQKGINPLMWIGAAVIVLGIGLVIFFGILLTRGRGAGDTGEAPTDDAPAASATPEAAVAAQPSVSDTQVSPLYGAVDLYVGNDNFAEITDPQALVEGGEFQTHTDSAALVRFNTDTYMEAHPETSISVTALSGSVVVLEQTTGITYHVVAGGLNYRVQTPGGGVRADGAAAFWIIELDEGWRFLPVEGSINVDIGDFDDDPLDNLVVRSRSGGCLDAVGEEIGDCAMTIPLDPLTNGVEPTGPLPTPMLPPSPTLPPTPTMLGT